MFKYLTLLLFVNTAFAIDTLSLNTLSIADELRINNLINTEKKNIHKQLSCPMESKSLNSILAQAETIRALFKNSDCMADETKVDQLVSSLNTVSDTMEEAGPIDTNVLNQEVNGQQVSAVFSNLNNIFYKSKCTLKNKGLLNYTADLVQSFAQMSLLMPSANGLIVAGGGMLASSMLKLISSLFDKDFNFKDSSDRNNFIKLNCSFFDLRRSVDNLGVRDIHTKQHDKVLQEVKELDHLITRKISQLERNKNKLLSQINIMKTTYATNKIGDVKQILSILRPYRDSLSKSLMMSNLYERETIKRNQNLYYYSNYETIISTVSNVLSFKINQNLLFDWEIKEILKEVTPQKIISMTVENYDLKVRVPLHFQVNRIINQLEQNIKKVNAQFLITIISGDQTANQLINLVNKQSLDNLNKLSSYELALQPLATRLYNINSGNQDYSYLDEGTEKAVSLQEEFNKIKQKIYGKWGNEFLDHVIKYSLKSNKEFASLFKSYSKDHFDQTGDVAQKYNDATFEFDKMFSCQDAKPIRDLWKNAKNLIEDGYDFIITNQSMFHKDFHEGLFSITDSTREKIQRHHKSAIIAKQFFKDKGSISKQYMKYINKTGLRKKLLGAVMIEVEKNKLNAQTLQALIEKNKCVSRGFE